MESSAIALLQNLDRRQNVICALPFTHRDSCGDRQFHDGAT